MNDARTAASGADNAAALHTVIALFDDTIEAEHTLMELRRSELPAEQISVILRERVLELDAATPYRAVLSRVVAASALDVVGSWLQGLASLVLPDRATYLAAGPIGVMLATIHDAHPSAPDAEPVPRQGQARLLTRALIAFGFEQDEASYVEQRVVAGSPLIAATSDNVETLRTAHQVFSRNSAVYIGLARTEQRISSHAARLLATGPRGGGSAVIADAVSPLQRLTEQSELHGGPWDLRGRPAVTQYGRQFGTVEDVLLEPAHEQPGSGIDPRALTCRYVVVGYGGVLGIGRHRVAIPAERVASRENEVIVRIAYEELSNAPRYDPLRPLSRQDEATIRRHFGEPFYWISPT